jgi:ABC-type uncharacterized transport system auxiliary subunit
VRRSPRIAALALGLSVLAGCGGAPPKDSFYRLPVFEAGDSMAPVDVGPIIYIPPFAADGLHGERALVYAHDDGTTLEQYTYHYWADSPRLMLQQALAARVRGTRRVVTTPSAEARYTLRGRIDCLDVKGTAKGATAEVSLEFELSPVDTDVPEFTRSVKRSVALGDDRTSARAAALAAAAEDALASFVSDLNTNWGHPTGARATVR